MDNSLPHIDILPNHQEHYKQAGGKRSYRLLVFLSVFLLSLLLGLTYVYSRPALYKSHATLLTVAQTAIDQQSRAADIQHVAIQRQILLGEVLLAETLLRLKQTQEYINFIEQNDPSSELSVSNIRHILSVTEIPKTNLVELAATGYQVDVFVPLLNTWIDVYLENRAEEIRQTTGVTIEILQEELTGLENKISSKRSELDHFREINNITSLGRENIFENESLARFKGLNRSLNAANEEAIKSKAHLDAVKKSIAEGDVVVPDKDKQGMRALELRLQKLRKQLAELDQKYTRAYLALHPNLNRLPEQIEKLEKEIQKKQHDGKSIVLTDAEQKNEAAKLTLIELTKQLEEHKQEAAKFSSKFSLHESLMTDLEGLEVLHRDTQERLVQIEAKQAEKFPQVKVIERAFFPRKPISPNYTRDAIIALVGAIFVGLFSVWFYEFLMRKEKTQASISISGINMYGNSSPGLSNSSQSIQQPLEQDVSQALHYENNDVLEDSSLADQALSVARIDAIDALLEASDIKAKQLIALLLSGLKLDEISRLKAEHFDFSLGVINVTGSNPRGVILNNALKALFEDVQPCPSWSKTQPISEQTLTAILVYACADAGLSKAQEIKAESLSNAYIIYLVKQGLRLSELEQLVGYIEPTDLSKYSVYSPEKKGLSVSEINLLHPSLSVYAG